MFANGLRLSVLHISEWVSVCTVGRSSAVLRVKYLEVGVYRLWCVDERWWILPAMCLREQEMLMKRSNGLETWFIQGLIIWSFFASWLNGKRIVVDVKWLVKAIVSGLIIPVEERHSNRDCVKVGESGKMVSEACWHQSAESNIESAVSVIVDTIN